MLVLPAIDILGGRVVRLLRGNFDDVTFYNAEPVEEAKRWEAQGAEWLHVVDLDGAAKGEPANIAQVEEIIRAVGIPVQVGGGIRSLQTLDRLYDAGAARTVLGTALIADPELVDEAAYRYPGVVAGIDARDGRVAIQGWRRGTEREALELAEAFAAHGVRRVVYTDISRDGAQTGPNLEAYRALMQRTAMCVIASGGIASVDDVVALRDAGVEGAIIGRAIYEGAVSLPEAIAAARAVEMPPC